MMCVDLLVSLSILCIIVAARAMMCVELWNFVLCGVFTVQYIPCQAFSDSVQIVQPFMTSCCSS